MEISYGVHPLACYRRACRLPPGKLNDDTLGRVNGLVTDLLDADREESLDVIESES